jgi:CspA family cold shock protein
LLISPCDRALSRGQAHCPDGLTDEVWAHSVRAYAALQADGKHMGVVIPADGGAPEAPPGGVESGGSTLTGAVGNGAEEARVVRFFADKRFGFVQRASGGKDVFFHLNALPAGARTPRTGDRVTVTIGKDRKGKLACTTVLPQGAAATDATATPDGTPDADAGPTVMLPCFTSLHTLSFTP